MLDHYQVLGVERGSTQEVISAAYRALAKAFHPDVFKGDRYYAETRLKAINAAYDIIGDPLRRQSYDRDLDRDGSSDLKCSNEWERACQFFPDISRFDKILAEINGGLSTTYRHLILERRAFSSAESIYESLLNEFVAERFGGNDLLQVAGLTALRMGKRRLALAINRACSLIGDGEPVVILTRLAKENYEDAKSVYLACGLGAYLPKEIKSSIGPGLYRIGDMVRFRVLPDASINVFHEKGRERASYRHLPDLDSFLAIYQANYSEIEPYEGGG